MQLVSSENQMIKFGLITIIFLSVLQVAGMLDIMIWLGACVFTAILVATEIDYR
jgi:hypothetical protein